jgi:hypothetical protein
VHSTPDAGWKFAVQLENLLDAGSSLNALRWLSRRNYVLHRPHARKIASVAATPVTFPQGCRFVLTELGLRQVKRESRHDTSSKPMWDPVRGELSFAGELVKRYRDRWSLQRIVLDAFEEAGWPEQLADPLPRLPSTLYVKKRLHDTIKNLNRAHRAVILRFYRTDCGRSVGWRQLR